METSGKRAGHGVAIVTLTMNPALDVTTGADLVRPTDKIRCRTARYDAGGGGINVARVATVLGASVAAVFPVGGPTGDLVTELVADADVPYRRVAISESTRESFTVDEATSGQQYRFVLPGPRLTVAEQTKCLDELRYVARTAQIVVASGSLPPGVPMDFYQRVADMCRQIGVPLVLDTSGGGLAHIDSGVFLLKPSVRELRECFDRDLATESEQLAAAHELIDAGVSQAVVVSVGSEGALLATSAGSQRFPAAPVHVVSGVGAGDAMVAAITVGVVRGWSLSKSVKFGIATGAAMLMTPGTAPCRREDTERIFDSAPEPEDVVTEQDSNAAPPARGRALHLR
ncbi:1-phosphofructokinase family hexose kinase [Mycolicibacterium sp.]|uniref:1-phosphofructokinase family hexose kinase n=1 Tax=Mycolicibacterium sp. TaxID=2320850 RepID=UPI001A34AD8C|nr:1-phosphofructokinase family hexose kinase [Mycolicibacterium sp.]MBJ7338152.1 1-phosphofructokinase family hexose kinase [Mycolicibacterium sp.]